MTSMSNFKLVLGLELMGLEALSGGEWSWVVVATSYNCGSINLSIMQL